MVGVGGTKRCYVAELVCDWLPGPEDEPKLERREREENWDLVFFPHPEFPGKLRFTYVV